MDNIFPRLSIFSKDLNQYEYEQSLYTFNNLKIISIVTGLQDQKESLDFLENFISQNINQRDRVLIIDFSQPESLRKNIEKKYIYNNYPLYQNRKKFFDEYQYNVSKNNGKFFYSSSASFTDSLQTLVIKSFPVLAVTPNLGYVEVDKSINYIGSGSKFENSFKNNILDKVYFTAAKFDCKYVIFNMFEHLYQINPYLLSISSHFLINLNMYNDFDRKIKILEEYAKYLKDYDAKYRNLNVQYILNDAFLLNIIKNDFSMLGKIWLDKLCVKDVGVNLLSVSGGLKVNLDN